MFKLTVIILILILEFLNIVSWLVYSVFGLLFLDGPNAKYSDLSFVLVILLLLVLVMGITIYLQFFYIKQNTSVSWPFVAILVGFILSLTAGSIPGYLKLLGKVEYIEKENSFNVLIKESIEKNTQLSQAKTDEYFLYLQQDKNINSNIKQFEVLLKNGLIEGDVIERSLSLDIAFLRKVFELGKIIQHNGKLAYPIILLPPQDAVEKVTLLLERGLDVTIPDYKDDSGDFQSFTDIVKKWELATERSLQRKNSSESGETDYMRSVKEKIETIKAVLKIIEN